MLLWFGIVIIRIQRPSGRKAFRAAHLREPHFQSLKHRANTAL